MFNYLKHVLIWLISTMLFSLSSLDLNFTQSCCSASTEGNFLEVIFKIFRFLFPKSKQVSNKYVMEKIGFIPKNQRGCAAGIE